MKELRVSAYAVCVDDGKVLLARWVSAGGERLWTLPGGGLDHAEDPLDAAVREVEEETGYTVAVDTLLGMSTIRRRHPRGPGREADFHGLGIVYDAHVVGGTLRHEVGGSTDQAAWVDLGQVAALDRIALVDIGLELHRVRPPNGRATGVPAP
ncbi:NUDIX hydrolase [Nonomuraea sp. K274]|uniref:NUDIX hydrolase n=1 Tax=Nonomuraea cypriaca TaxID=1187855 RepID=A0A931F2Y7_9ACTN|nr:NUDIX hydrolase [Nonomuraea cypriaca]